MACVSEIFLGKLLGELRDAIFSLYHSHLSQPIIQEWWFYVFTGFPD
jgi:hypothetical protein